jgi:hypothetical protein
MKKLDNPGAVATRNLEREKMVRASQVLGGKFGGIDA